MTKVEELRDTITTELSAFYEDRRMDNPAREAALYVDSLIAAARQEGAEQAIRESSVGTLTCHSGMLGQTYGDKPITSFNEGDRYALVLLPKEANSEQT